MGQRSFDLFLGRLIVEGAAFFKIQSYGKAKDNLHLWVRQILEGNARS
jgi:hypothetical protein